MALRRECPKCGQNKLTTKTRKEKGEEVAISTKCRGCGWEKDFKNKPVKAIKDEDYASEPIL